MSADSRSRCQNVNPRMLIGNPDQLINVYIRLSEIMEEKGIEDVGRVGIYGITYKENVDDIRES